MADQERTSADGASGRDRAMDDTQRSHAPEADRATGIDESATRGLDSHDAADDERERPRAGSPELQEARESVDRAFDALEDRSQAV
jgi:hypothetical protein